MFELPHMKRQSHCMLGRSLESPNRICLPPPGLGSSSQRESSGFTGRKKVPATSSFSRQTTRNACDWQREEIGVALTQGRACGCGEFLV